MSKHSLPFAAVAVLSLLSGCAVMGPKPSFPQQGTSTATHEPGAQTSAVPTEEQATSESPRPNIEEGQRPGPREFHLGTAASALVAQAHQQASGGNYQAAGATLERALRIEPGNPLLYIELGQVRMQEGNVQQASGFGHKALQLATGDSQAQAQAWRLIADSLRAQGKDPEAADAERRADSLATR